MKIQKLFKDVRLEDEQYEFKAKLNKENPLKWAKTIVAFANGQGGIIFVGVSDDGDAFGLKLREVDETKNLVNVVNNRYIFPHVKYKFSVRSIDDDAEKFILCLQVLPSDSIVVLKEGDFSEMVKGDGSSIPASPADIVRLSKRKYGVDDYLTEEEYDSSKWSDYLDLCSTYRKAFDQPSLKELQNMEIVSADGRVKSGFLMFRDDYAENDSLTCLRLFKGKNKAGIVLDSKRIKGPLSHCLKEAISFIDRNTKVGWQKTADGGREELRSYPKIAVREALVNAFAHRDYSIMGKQIDVDIFDDRIDITSPGSWLLPKKYEEYSIGSIPSIRRNQMISAIFSVANLMERGGTGFETIVSSYRDADKEKQPVVMSYPGFLIVRLYDLLYSGEEVVRDELTEMKTDIKSLVLRRLSKGPATISELQELSSYKSRYYFTIKVIRPLMDSGLIEKIGNTYSPKSYYQLKK